MSIKYIIIVATIIATVSTPLIDGSEMGKSPAAAKSVGSGGVSEEKKAKSAVDSLSREEKSQLLNLLNEGSDKELTAIKGIAKSRSKEIIKARPFQSVEDLVKVKGIGLATFSKVIDHSKVMTAPKS